MQQYVTDSWCYVLLPPGCSSVLVIATKKTNFSDRVRSGLACMGKWSCQHPRSLQWWTIYLPFISESSYDNGDEGRSHCWLLEALQQKGEISPLKVKFYMLSLSYGDVPTGSPATECNSFVNCDTGHSWTLQSKSEVVWFGSAKGKTPCSI